MTVLRGGVIGLLMLTATVLLVGFGGIAGLLVWLALVCAVGCWPDTSLRIVTMVRAHHVRAAWRWLDRR